MVNQNPHTKEPAACKNGVHTRRGDDPFCLWCGFRFPAPPVEPNATKLRRDLQNPKPLSKAEPMPTASAEPSYGGNGGKVDLPKMEKLAEKLREYEAPSLPEADVEQILNDFRQSSIIIHAQGSVRGVEEDARAFKQSLEDAKTEINAYFVRLLKGLRDKRGIFTIAEPGDKHLTPVVAIPLDAIDTAISNLEGSK